MCLFTLLLSGPVLADVQPGVWEGSGVCGDIRRAYRLSIEPGEREFRSVFDRLDAPGGRVIARQINSVPAPRNPTADEDVVLRINYSATRAGWWIKDFNEPEVPPYLVLSADNATITERSDRRQYCTDFELRQEDAQLALGGASNASELPQRMAGTWYCNRPVGRLGFEIQEVRGNSFDGVITLGSHPDQQAGETGTMSFLGEFDPQSGTLTMIGDQWLESSGRNPEIFDMTVTLREGGTRGIGIRSTRTCQTVELSVEGHQIASDITPANTAIPVTEWLDPSACITLIHWASQALPEAGVNTLYSSIQVSRVREIGTGLLVDARFVPFFGKPYEDLDAVEKEHVSELGDYCTRLIALETPMRHSGAAQYADYFFPQVNARRPDQGSLATIGPRLRLLKGRLDEEMAELAGQPVTEADIPTLTDRLIEVEDRFSDLWQIDRQTALDLINNKLDEARGDLEQRLVAEIESLPLDLAAYYEALDIESGIRLLAVDRERFNRLQTALNSRLESIADELLTALAIANSPASGGLPALERFVNELDGIWPTINEHVSENGAGTESIAEVAERLAADAYAGFAEQAQRVMGAAEDFYQREQAYRTVVYLHATYTPNAAFLSEVFIDYHTLVDSMVPVPTLADLVEENGEPSSLGIKLATAGFVNDFLSGLSMAFPYDIFGFASSIRVGAAIKEACSVAEADSYWCNFRLRVTGNLPMAGMLGNIPSRARFQLQGDEWVIVETPPSSSNAGSAGGSDSCGLPLGCSAGEIGANGVMAGLW